MVCVAPGAYAALCDWSFLVRVNKARWTELEACCARSLLHHAISSLYNENY